MSRWFRTDDISPSALYGNPTSGMSEVDEALIGVLPTLTLLESAMDPVSEGYIGKTQNILKIEQCFKSMLDKYGTTSLRNRAYHDLDRSQEKREIEDLLKKEFGFKSANIIIRPVAVKASLTYTSSMLIRDWSCEMPTGLTAHGEKYYDFDHNYNYYQMMTTEYFDNVLTPDELTAILLRSVGYNFDICTMSYIGDLLFWLLCLSPAGIIYQFWRQEINMFIQRVLNMIDGLTPLRMLANYGLNAAKLISMALGPIGGIPTALQIILRAGADPVNTVINMLTGFGRERFADSFVAAYGYGSSLISAIDKLDRWNVTTRKGGIIDTWTWAGTVAPTVLLMFIDPAPENQSRARLLLDDMRELATSPDLPPNIRRSVQADYERCNKAYEAFLQVEPEKRNGMVLRLSRNFKEHMGGRVDFRTYLYRCSAIQEGVWRGRRRA